MPTRLGRAAVAAGVFAIAVLGATPALANMILPLYFIPALLAVIAVIPVIALEAFIVIRYLGRHVRRDAGDVGVSVAIANAASLVAGFAVVWLFAQFDLQFAAAAKRGDFLGGLAKSFRGTEHPDPVADVAAVLLVQLIFFFVSWWMEGLVLWKLLGLQPRTAIRASLLANGLSYLILTGLMFV